MSCDTTTSRPPSPCEPSATTSPTSLVECSSSTNGWSSPRRRSGGCADQPRRPGLDGGGAPATRALRERPPEAVAAAAIAFITGPWPITPSESGVSFVAGGSMGRSPLPLSGRLSANQLSGPVLTGPAEPQAPPPRRLRGGGTHSAPTSPPRRRAGRRPTGHEASGGARCRPGSRWSPAWSR